MWREFLQGPSLVDTVPQSCLGGRCHLWYPPPSPQWAPTLHSRGQMLYSHFLSALLKPEGITFFFSLIFLIFIFSFYFFFQRLPSLHCPSASLPLTSISQMGASMHTTDDLQTRFHTLMLDCDGQGGLSSWAPQNCNNQGDSSWQTTTPGALHK